MRKVLAVLTINPDYHQFALPELKSFLRKLPFPLTTLLQNQISQPLPPKSHQITQQNIANFPFITITVPNFQSHRKFFQQACLKSVMLSKFLLLISQGSNYQQLLNNRSQQVLKQQSRKWSDQVKCNFQSRNRVITKEQQLRSIKRVLGDMDVRGTINIDKSDKRYELVEDHQWFHQHHQTEEGKTLKRVYFGIQLSTNKEGRAKFNYKYELSKRIYLGPTSTANDLAFLMCNQAKVEAGKLVLDPFVGTGGMLIPPASYGAITFGADLDMRVLNGYSVGRINKKSSYYAVEKKLELFTPKIYLNFDQYGFERPNIFRMDSTKLFFRKTDIFDAIITDPPYGVRAMSRTVQKKERVEKLEPEEEMLEKVEETIPSQQGEEQHPAEEQQPGEEEQKKEQQSEQQKQSWQKPSQQQSIQQPFQQQQTQQTCQQQPTKEQLSKRFRKQLKKQNRIKRKQLLTEQQKQQKVAIVRKLNRQRIDNWQKYDSNHIEVTQRQKIFLGLLNFARVSLKAGGRLVFLYPVFADEEFMGEKSLPPYEGFELIDMSQQKLSKKYSRMLVTLEKKGGKSDSVNE